MPRKARIDAPGALHHIIIRGIERKAIFKDGSDRENFLDRLGALVSESKTACYGWVLMTNHVHLLLKTGMSPVATVMRRLLTGYAVSFNRRHRRHGQLFQNRYKSFLCEQEPYLKELVRYIHLNPLRAKMVKDLKELKSYPYCGHGVLLGKVKNDWQDSEYVLNLFGASLGSARRAYGAFVAKGVAKGRRPDLVGGGLLSTLTKARTVLSYIAVRKLMISCADVARKLTISPTTVSRAASRATSLPKLKQIQKELLGS